jgi:hypothetical protein
VDFRQAVPRKKWRFKPLHRPIHNRHWQRPGRYHKKLPNSRGVDGPGQVDSKSMVEALEAAVKPRLARIATDAATAENDDGNFMSEVAEAAEVRALSVTQRALSVT